MDLRKNIMDIKEYALRYRKEITIFGGIILEEIPNDTGITFDEYVTVFNELSDEIFIGNLLSAVMIEPVMESIRDILSGKKEYIDFAMESYRIFIDDEDEFRNEFLRRMKE